MNSAQTVLHLLKNDIRHQRWLLLSWVLLGFVFIAVVSWTGNDTYTLKKSLAVYIPNGTDIVLGSGYLWMLLLAPLILCLNIITSDPAPGSDRFWMTRPISGKSIFSEKLIFLLFIATFHLALFYFIRDLRTRFFETYSLFIFLFGILFAQLTIFPRKFISVLCVVIYVFLMSKFYESTIFSRVQFLEREPIQISALPSILALLIPFVFLLVGIGNQYITRRTKRTVIFFAFSVLFAGGATENSSVPLEFLEIKEAIPCKGTIQSSEKDVECFYDIRDTKKERKFRSNITDFNVPKSEVNCYWIPYATKNPNAQHWGDWIYQDEWFNFGAKVSATIEEKPVFRNSDFNGIRNVLNEDLKSPNWLSQEKFVKDALSQKAIFVSDKKEIKLPLQIFLKEKKMTRVTEGPLGKENFVISEKDGNFYFEKTFSKRPFIRITENPDKTYSLKDYGFLHGVFIVLHNPRLNEARFFGNYSSLGYGYDDPINIRDARIISPEWRKDARIIIYRITDTERTGRATLENPTK
jgi:hypothetical protein